MALETWGFLKKLLEHTVQGDPLAIVEDIRASAEEEKKKDPKDAQAIEAEGTSDE